jgi:hypothetical protein
MLQTAMEGGQEKRQSVDPFWDFAPRELLTSIIDLLTLSGNRLSIRDLLRVIRNAPNSTESARCFLNPAFRKELQDAGKPVWDGECYRRLLAAAAAQLDDARANDLSETTDYLTNDFPSMHAELRTSVVATLMARLTGLARSPFAQLFDCTTTVTPEDTFNGKIHILDLPIKEYGEVGRLAQTLYKLCWQRSVERRGNKGRDVFLWADEGQHFVTKADMLFLQTARESRATTVYLTQSVANIRGALDDRGNSTHASDSFLGNFQTMLFHANGCPATNEFAERVFGREIRSMGSAAMSPDGDILTGIQKGFYPEVPAIRFTTLKKGGPANDYLAEAVVFQSGRRWSANHRKNWLLGQFKQNF